MSKQDRQGARTPADLERKHSRVLSGQDDTNARQSHQIEQIAQAVNGSTTSTNYAIQQLTERMNAVEDTLSGMEGDDSSIELSARMDTAEGDIDNLEAADQSMDARISALENADTTQGGTSGLTALESRMTTVETTLSSLEARVAALEGV